MADRYTARGRTGFRVVRPLWRAVSILRPDGTRHPRGDLAACGHRSDAARQISRFFAGRHHTVDGRPRLRRLSPGAELRAGRQICRTRYENCRRAGRADLRRAAGAVVPEAAGALTGHAFGHRAATTGRTSRTSNSVCAMMSVSPSARGRRTNLETPASTYSAM